jgi:L-alanine-DL-glutamate epimerase-like enolase superfamily enzyme
VEVTAADVQGFGYTYADQSAAKLIHETLAPKVLHSDALAIQARWQDMVHAIRNLGRPGIASMAIAAVDVALWDLKARIFQLPLVQLLGAARESVPVYGSGGFTSYSIPQLQAQLKGWVDEGIPRVKMKIGREPRADLSRVRAAREAIGPGVELFVDANGGYDAKQALAQAEVFASLGVSWFEEPVSSDDLAGLHLLRDRAPTPIEIAAGEYGYSAIYFRRMLEAHAIDVLQADASRCAGITGFLQAAALCEAFQMPLSAHTAPALHLHVCCAAPRVRHLEYFFDHTRIEQMFFEGAIRPVHGVLRPDLSRPGLGLELKRADVERYFDQSSSSTRSHA